MSNDRSWESYDSLFGKPEDITMTQTKEISSKKEETERFYTELKRSLGQESISNESLEQNSINNSINGDEFSFEADDEGGSFEDAAAEEENSGDNSGDSSDEPPSMDDMPSMDDGSGGDDFSGDSDSMDGGDSDMGGDDSGDSSDDNGIDEIDNNKGSSLNPYTQINQKQYCIDRLNELEKSVNGAIEQYSSQYADWSEVDQLRELLGIIREQKRSFIMQQNPENLIKIGLYYDIYDKIVQNLVNKIEDRESNNKNRDH